MSRALTIRLTEEQRAWLERVAKATGRPRAVIGREQVEKARAAPASRPFMRLAGSMAGPRDLSSLKGFFRS